MGQNRTEIIVEGRRLSLSNLNKLYWPDDGYTKGQLVAYYTKVFSYLAPYLKDRPLVITRYPEGIGGQFFYQKNLPAGPLTGLLYFLYRAKVRNGNSLCDLQ